MSTGGQGQMAASNMQLSKLYRTLQQTFTLVAVLTYEHGKAGVHIKTSKENSC